MRVIDRAIFSDIIGRERGEAAWTYLLSFFFFSLCGLYEII